VATEDARDDGGGVRGADGGREDADARRAGVERRGDGERDGGDEGDEGAMSGDEEARLLEAIRAAPDDDGARLAYAAFLDGRGDPRGELVRIEVELMRLKPRLAVLRKTLDPAWLAAVGRQLALVLVVVDPAKKIQTVRWVREASGLGLRESLDVVEAALARGPQVVRDQLEPEEGERLLALFAGTAEVRLERRPRPRR